MIPFATSFSLIILPFSLTAQSERTLMGKVAIQKPITLGKIKVSCTEQIDTIPENFNNTINGAIKIEKTTSKVAIETENIVFGLMLIEPIKSNKKLDISPFKKRLTTSKDTIK
tara:strand:- start:1136 stop:1474 length:339 start_codon:yes stop_codon:yes gene_type:complete